MGARGEYGKSKRNDRAVLEENRRAATGKEKSDTEEDVKSRCLLDGQKTSRRHDCF